jgi:hypothetical protein
MGRLLIRVAMLAIVGFVSYRALQKFGILGDEGTVEFEWADDVWAFGPFRRFAPVEGSSTRFDASRLFEWVSRSGRDSKGGSGRRAYLEHDRPRTGRPTTV